MSVPIAQLSVQRCCEQNVSTNGCSDGSARLVLTAPEHTWARLCCVYCCSRTTHHFTNAVSLAAHHRYLDSRDTAVNRTPVSPDGYQHHHAGTTESRNPSSMQTFLSASLKSGSNGSPYSRDPAGSVFGENSAQTRGLVMLSAASLERNARYAAIRFTPHRHDAANND